MNLFYKLKKILLVFTVMSIGIMSVSCNAETNDSNQSFPEFWKVFRKASLENDISRILEMTKFPFKVKADLDMGGSITIDKAGFQKRFNEFMDQDIRENLSPESMRHYIEKNKLISSRVDDLQNNVALFSFEVSDGIWYFVNVYVEDI